MFERELQGPGMAVSGGMPISWTVAEEEDEEEEKKGGGRWRNTCLYVCTTTISSQRRVMLPLFRSRLTPAVADDRCSRTPQGVAMRVGPRKTRAIPMTI